MFWHLLQITQVPSSKVLILWPPCVGVSLNTFWPFTSPRSPCFPANLVLEPDAWAPPFLLFTFEKNYLKELSDRVLSFRIIFVMIMFHGCGSELLNKCRSGMLHFLRAEVMIINCPLINPNVNRIFCQNAF